MEWGMPLLAMMYPRGPNVLHEKGVAEVSHAARVASELGADIVKTPYTGDPDSFREVTLGCHVPVVVAGGARGDDFATLQMIEGAMQGGAAGISIGRNAFQHPHPDLFVRAMTQVVHERRSAEEAFEILRNRNGV
jgi:fructose-bisphosphate aldolase/2-amino-3,7-dideoxy-D-threo-hept-6-ulosonate synthase